jgi:MraZ protein
MTNFLGEYECKLDAKGRAMLPSAIKKQLQPAAQEKFVINRGFEKCLTLYPMNEWEQISKDVNKLNMYVKENREFVRRFFNGATELELDAAGRLLFPKRLLAYSGIDKDIVFVAMLNKIEIWPQDTYNKLMNEDVSDFAGLAEKVMGMNKNND